MNQLCKKISTRAVKGSSTSLCLVIDSCDDQWRCVLPFVTNTRAEKGENPLRKRTPSEGVDVRHGVHVKERDRPFFIISKHTDSLRLLLERQTDRGWIQSAVFVSVPQPHCPIAVLRLGGDHPLPVDRLFDHPQVPEGLCPHCNLMTQRKRIEDLILGSCYVVVAVICVIHYHHQKKKKKKTLTWK